MLEDTVLCDTKRWVRITPKGSNGTALVLAKATNEEQINCVGKQTGGRVFLFLHTNDFERDYENLLNQNVKIVREAHTEPYGKAAVFEDLYGNLWDMLELINGQSHS